jgi:hypothetical protein
VFDKIYWMIRVFLFFLLLFPMLLLAQGSPTYLSIEAGGSGLVTSINVGKPIIMHTSFRLNFQWGLGISPKIVDSKPPINIPSQLTCSFGRRNSFFEVGIGSSLVLGSRVNEEVNKAARTEMYLSPIIGIRHETRRWFGRFYACPLFNVSGASAHDDLTAEFINIGVGIGTIF